MSSSPEMSLDEMFALELRHSPNTGRSVVTVPGYERHRAQQQTVVPAAASTGVSPSKVVKLVAQLREAGLKTKHRKNAGKTKVKPGRKFQTKTKTNRARPGLAAMHA